MRMKVHLGGKILVAVVLAAIFLVAVQMAQVQTQPPVSRCPLQVTPQAVVIGEAVNGTTKIAMVTVTNTSNEPVQANILWGVDWFQVSPASINLPPRKSTRLTVTGNLSKLQQIINAPGREGQIVEFDQRPVAGMAPVTISAGKTGTLFVVFGVRMAAK